MVQGMWLDEVWQTTDKIKRPIKTFSVKSAVKTKEDNEETKVTGNELETVSLTFSTSLADGGNPKKEYDELAKKVGQADTLCIGVDAIGSDVVMLKSVRISSQFVDNNGVVIFAEIELQFVEVDMPGSNSNMVVKIDGKDVTKDLAIERAILEEYSEGHADILEMRFSDPYGQWAKWAKSGELLGLNMSVSEGTVKSGTLFVHSLQPKDTTFILRAMSVPPDVFRETSKSWESTTLEMIAEEIATAHALKFKKYNTQGITRDYVRQDTENDFEFLQKRCKLEGASFLVYDSTLVLYDEKSMEAEKPTLALNIDSNYIHFTPDENESAMVKTMVVQNGEFTGSYTDENTKSDAEKTIRISETVPDEAGMTTIAQSYCRENNKNCRAAVIDCALQGKVAAGSVIELETETRPSFKGAVFVSSLRHNFVTNKTRLNVRKTLAY
nr:MAG TPA: tail protein [Caudoviricetes sp.]